MKNPERGVTFLFFFCYPRLSTINIYDFCHSAVHIFVRKSSTLLGLFPNLSRKHVKYIIPVSTKSPWEREREREREREGGKGSEKKNVACQGTKENNSFIHRSCFPSTLQTPSGACWVYNTSPERSKLRGHLYLERPRMLR